MSFICNTNPVLDQELNCGLDHNTILLLPGSDIRDHSYFEHNVLITNNVSISTDRAKFGSTSIKINSGNIIVGEHPLFTFNDRDFTIDFWINFDVITECELASGNSNEWVLGTVGGLKKRLYFYISGSTRTIGNTDLKANTWYHIAIVRNGNSIKLYLNGITELTTTVTDWSITQTNFIIGKYNVYAWINEFRVSLNIARWKSEFIPSSIPYTNLEIFGDERFNTVFEGDAPNPSYPEAPNILSQISITSPLDVEMEGIELETSDTNDLFDFNYDNWTFDCWMVLSNTLITNVIFCNGFQFNEILFRYDGPSKKFELLLGKGDSWKILQFNYNILTNKRYHIALTRYFSKYSLFVDGVLIGTGYSAIYPDLTGAILKIGSSYDINSDITGTLDNIRLIRGIIGFNENISTWNKLYTSNILIDTSFDDISHIELHNHPIMLNGTNISNVVSKSSNYSLSFNNDQYVTFIGNDLGVSSDMTYEFWLYLEGDSSQTTQVEYRHWSEDPVITIMSSNTVPHGTWHHIAITKQESTLKLWVNGQFEGSAISNLPLVPTGYLNCGWTYPDKTGYVDNIVFTDRIAKYTSNFTVV